MRQINLHTVNLLPTTNECSLIGSGCEVLNPSNLLT